MTQTAARTRTEKKSTTPPTTSRPQETPRPASPPQENTYRGRYWLNEVAFIGRVGRDPEMSYTTGGKAVTKFSLAVSQGEKKETMWLNVVCWEDLATTVNEEVGTGDLVEVRGKLTQRKYNEKYYHDVVPTVVEVLQSKGRAIKTKIDDDDPSSLDDSDLDEHPF